MLSRFRPQLLAIGLSVLLGPAAAHGLVLDWSAVTWAPGTTSNSYDVNGDGVNDITVTFGGDLTTFATQNSDGTGSMTPIIDTNLHGGQSPVRPSLDISGNLHTNSFLTITVTFSPQFTQGIGNVSFSIFGISQETNDDRVTNISATPIGPFGFFFPVAATITNVGPAVSLTGTGLNQILEGVAAVPNAGPSSGNGNATIGFGTNWISSFSFTFENTAGAPRFQQIAISNIDFTPAPEINPSATAAGVCVIAAAVHVWRFRRRNQNA
jgi:hypothetical protein